MGVQHESDVTVVGADDDLRVWQLVEALLVLDKSHEGLVVVGFPVGPPYVPVLQGT